MTRITPKNESALRRKVVATPTAAIIRPASPGPTARARLNSIPLSARAGVRSSFWTNSGNIARHVGDSIASPSERANVSRSKSQGVIVPVKVTTVRTTATANIHISVPKINLRRSKMSPIEPAGSASRKNGKAEAV